MPENDFQTTNGARRRWLLGAAAAAAMLAGCGTVPTEPQAPTTPTLVVPPPVAAVTRPPRLGLALGGGAARGFAHVGVIQVLEEAGIKPDLVVGTSAGSLVGALYASGKNGAQLLNVAKTMEEAAFTDWTLPVFSRGMFKGEALGRYVSDQLGGKRIQDLPMPLGIVATDLNSGEGVLFQRGDTATAVRASSAVPAVFMPVKIGAHEYVDGGLVSPVPVRYARQMGAEVVLAVDISAAPEGNQASDSLQILLQTTAIMGKSINHFELQKADVVVRPALNDVGSANFQARLRSVEAGRKAMLAMLPKLKAELLAKRQPEVN